MTARMSTKRIVAGLVVAMCAASMLPATAASENIAPPFAGSTEYRSGCFFVSLTATCSADQAENLSGVLESSLKIVSPQSGALPGTADVGSTGILHAYQEVHDARIVLYTVDFTVTQARATHTGGLPVELSSGYVGLYGSASDHNGNTYSDGFSVDLAGTSQSESLDGHYQRTFFLAPRDGERIDGLVQIDFELDASARLGSSVATGDTGALDVGAHVRIDSVKADVVV